MLSCIIIGQLCDLIGRKWSLLSLALPNILGWLLIIFSQNVEMIYVGRFIGGLSSGAFSMYGVLYISELCEKDHRGALGTIIGSLLIWGVLIAYILGFALNSKGSAIVSCCFPVLFGLLFLLQPESPYYELQKGNDEEALRILKRFRGKFHDVRKELEQIKFHLEEEKLNKVSILESFKRSEARTALWVSFGLMLIQQASGLNAVIYYTSIIFNSAGIDENILNSQISTIIVGALEVIGSIFAILVIEKVNRRIYLSISGSFITVSLVLIGVYYTLQERNLVTPEILADVGVLPLLGMFIFILSLGASYGPLAFLIPTEICPPELKGIITSVAATFSWFLAFIVTKFYLNLKNTFGGDVTFYIFAVFGILAIIFPLFIPETRGKTLAEIQNEVKGK
ncbi:facilitated trehalose transporter Tret1-like isoform X2 [Agrilus planipennis]|nr:facilitated trehalose transporter Tret1-like isoform X2 [Agrilus planipennis]